MNHLYSALLPRDRDRSATAVLTPGGAPLTFADLDRMSARYAAALTSFGVTPGDRVAAQIDKSLEALLLYLGCLRAGAVFLPLNTAYTPTEMAHFITDAEPRATIVRPEQCDLLRGAFGDATRIETLGTQGDGSLAARAGTTGEAWNDVPRGPNDLAAILYTSGTTGRSKGAMLTHENLRSNAAALVEIWRFTPADVLIHALPIFHTHGLFVATNVALMSGASMIFLPKFSPGEILDWMPKATALMGVPTFYTRLLDDSRLTREAAAGMRLFISGSAPLLAETHVAFEARTGHAILERYGMTETGMNTSNPYEGDRVPGAVGFPLPGVEVRITDTGSGERLAPDEIGMIEVRGPNVFCGYWRMPEKTKEEFRADGFFITGDLGKIDERGYVWILGRSKDLVISGGYNVYPKEVESEIDAIAGIRESAVIGVPHRDFGEAVVAVVVPETGATIDEASLLAELRGRLANYKLPKRIVVASELPRNAMAKVQKSQLREAHCRLFSS